MSSSTSTRPTTSSEPYPGQRFADPGRAAGPGVLPGKRRFLFVYIVTACLLAAVTGCSEQQVEELVFRKTLEYQLKDRCGDDNEACHEAVEEQIRECLRKSEWKRYLDSHEDEAEVERFVREFYPCFRDADGNPLFA